MKKIIITESQLLKITKNNLYEIKSRIEDCEMDFTIPINNGEYDVDLTIIAKYKFEDSGIGKYEFWGSSGYDSQIGFDFYGFTPKEGTFDPSDLPEITKWIDDNDSFLEDTFTEYLEDQHDTSDEYDDLD